VPILAATRPRIQPATIKPVWTERTLIFKMPSGRVHALDGWVYGTLAVHSTWAWRFVGSMRFDLPPVTITHQPSKLALAFLADVEEAVAKIEWLWDQCPASWLEEDIKGEMAAGRLPKDVVEWSRRHIPET
jgi:hypothetical protein